MSVEDIKTAQEHFIVTSVQNKYSVDNREWEAELEANLAAAHLELSIDDVSKLDAIAEPQAS